MNETVEKIEYSMEKIGESFTFSVREKRDCCIVKIDYISDAGAFLFFEIIKKFRVRACQLTSVAEDKALESVTEIFRELL